MWRLPRRRAGRGSAAPEPEAAVSPFATQLTNLLKARFPYLYIPTWEEERVLEEIQKVVRDKQTIKTPRQVYVWTSTQGLVGGDNDRSKDTKSPVRALEVVEQCAEPAVFVMKDLHVYFGSNRRSPDFELIRKIRDLVPTLKQSKAPKSVIFLAPTVCLPNELQKDVTIVDYDLPTFAEIRGLLESMIEMNRKTGIVIDLSSDDKEKLAKAALGLTLQEAENAFARAMVGDGRLDLADLEVVLDEKRQIIKKTEILEFIKPDLGMKDVGGLENLKRWLKKRDKSWLDSAQRYCVPAPKGVLLTGVPGCGKSLVAKAVSAMWQLPLLRLDVGRIFAGIVGSSEENMRRAIKTAEAIAPSILWIDEVEKGFTGTGSLGDSGTASRIFATFLTWMQEKTKPVFVIATANNIRMLPPEFLRKGRFDEIFFVDLPTKNERADIFRVHFRKRPLASDVSGDFRVTEDLLTNLADITEGFVGAEIEQAVVSGLFEAFSEDRCVLTEDFERSIRNTVPLSVTQAEQIQAIRDWANVRAVAATVQQDRAEYRPADSGSTSDVTATRGGRAVDF